DDAKAGYSLQHARDWQYVGMHQGQRHLKFVTQRGEWLADATVGHRTGPKIADAQVLDQILKETPGWQQDGEAQVDTTVKHPAGHRVIRLTASGTLDGAPALRTVYLVGDPNGTQVLITILTPPSQADQLADRGLALVAGVELKRP
ncbi:MAG: hypothetical protein NZO58_12390, partial [Gemmataceae bacterium]|nr:hypothetical protein [Gemmataceae bacterium]